MCHRPLIGPALRFVAIRHDRLLPSSVFPFSPKASKPTGRTFFVVATFHREITSSPRPTNTNRPRPRPRPRPRWNLVVTVLSSRFPPCCDKLLEDRETLEDADRVLMQRAGKKRSGGGRKCGFTCSRKLGRRWIIVRTLIRDG